MKKYIQLTAGRGPVECARAVTLVARELLKDFPVLFSKFFTFMGCGLLIGIPATVDEILKKASNFLKESK